MTSVIAFAPENPASRNWRAHCAMVEGIQRHGLKVEELVIGVDDWKPADVIVLNGWRKPGNARTNIIDAQVAAGGKLLVMDRGFTFRKFYWSAGWGGIKAWADYRNRGMAEDRWRALRCRPEVRDWRTDGLHIVVMGQKHGDAAITDIDIDIWADATIRELRQYTDRPIVFRGHPRSELPHRVNEAIHLVGSFEDAMRDCWAVVVFNSTSAINAILAGVPAFVTGEGSMAGPVANSDLRDIENPAMPERRQWLNDLAYAQWSLEEMARGDAWKHLNRKAGDV